MLLEQLALVGDPVLQVRRDYLEKAGHELDTKEQFRLAVEAPGEQINQRHQTIRLDHVISVLAQTAKLLKDLDAQIDNLRKVAQLAFGTC